VQLVTLLADGDVETALERLAWSRAGNELVKVVTRENFAEAMGFVNEVAGLSEAANHHPDIDIRWNEVTLHLSTHSAGGLTAKDLALAEQIDGLG
jgi:4a-hydroxytetrahydrobiopterin dehydratase